MLYHLLLLSGLATAQITSQPKAEKIEQLGVQSGNNANLGRDLGWSGRLGNTILNTYGDTTQCGLSTNAAFVSDNGCSVPSASNSVAEGDANDPTKVTNFSSLMKADGFADQFCGQYADEPDSNGAFAIGITQIQPVSDDESMLFFLINNRTDPYNQVMVGSGVAKVSMVNGAPQCDRIKKALVTGRSSEYFWNGGNEPNYGAYASMSGQDGYIYGYGEMFRYTDADNPVFVNRVPKGQYADLNAYEYWNGQAWQKNRLYNPPASAAVMRKTGQSSAHWSEHFQSYLMMGMNGALTGLTARLAKKPEGPWTDPSLVMPGHCIRAGACDYGGAMMPWYDPSGKTVNVIYSPAGSSTTLNVIKVTWA